MLTASQRNGIYGGILIAFVAVILLAVNLGPKHEEYLPKQGSDVRIELTTTPGFAVATPPLAMTVAEH